MTVIDKLALYDYCKDCTLRCCTGTPRVSEEKRAKITAGAKDCFQREDSGYYVTQHKNGFCKYYEDTKCSIQHVKPIDCQLFPMDPIFGEDYNISFVIESSCPACKEGLTPEFIATAILLGVDWIKEFSFEQFIGYWGKYKLSNPKHKIIGLKRIWKEKTLILKNKSKRYLQK